MNQETNLILNSIIFLTIKMTIKDVKGFAMNLLKKFKIKEIVKAECRCQITHLIYGCQSNTVLPNSNRKAHKAKNTFFFLSSNYFLGKLIAVP